MNEVSENIDRRSLVIQKLIDKYTEIVIMLEDGLRKILRDDLSVEANKNDIMFQIRLIGIYSGFVEYYKQKLHDKTVFLLPPSLSDIGDTNRLRKIEQEIRKKFDVPKSIPIIYK